jgi:hypothetical protein
MTQEAALRNLDLAPGATREDIEAAYQRLVRRYPPEFHPDRFRRVDDSYRLLTSLPFLLERLLCGVVNEPEVDPELLSFALSLPENALEEAIQEITKGYLVRHLWLVTGAREE